MTNDLNISLEPHLVESLRLLVPIASPELSEKLKKYISSEKPSTIPYSLLLSVSRWVRSAGPDTLQRHTPPLDPRAYTMVSLLAGSTTSPEKTFGTYIPPKDLAQLEQERHRERKEITALLNGLLSVIGSGFAVWWAADKTGWQNEWRVPLGLLAATIVAASEAALYLIWQKQHLRRAARKLEPQPSSASAQDKKYEGVDNIPSNLPSKGLATAMSLDGGGLRRRH